MTQQQSDTANGRVCEDDTANGRVCEDDTANGRVFEADTPPLALEEWNPTLLWTSAATSLPRGDTSQHAATSTVGDDAYCADNHVSMAYGGVCCADPSQGCASSSMCSRTPAAYVGVVAFVCRRKVAPRDFLYCTRDFFGRVSIYTDPETRDLRYVDVAPGRVFWYLDRQRMQHIIERQMADRLNGCLQPVLVMLDVGDSSSLNIPFKATQTPAASLSELQITVAFVVSSLEKIPPTMWLHIDHVVLFGGDSSEAKYQARCIARRMGQTANAEGADDYEVLLRECASAHRAVVFSAGRHGVVCRRYEPPPHPAGSFTVATTSYRS